MSHNAVVFLAGAVTGLVVGAILVGLFFFAIDRSPPINV